MTFFLQMFVILAASRLCGWLVRRFLRQPQVIGEMVAGVILGPSLLGMLAPEVQAYLFPADSRPVLYVVAQTGIALYMFLVGMDFRRDEFRANASGERLPNKLGPRTTPATISPITCGWRR